MLLQGEDASTFPWNLKDAIRFFWFASRLMMADDMAHTPGPAKQIDHSRLGGRDRRVPLLRI